MIESFLLSKIQRKDGALHPRFLISQSYIPTESMLFLNVWLALSDPNAVINVVSELSLLLTSAMFRPTPPKDVFHYPLQLW